MNNVKKNKQKKKNSSRRGMAYNANQSNNVHTSEQEKKENTTGPIDFFLIDDVKKDANNAKVVRENTENTLEENVIKELILEEQKAFPKAHIPLEESSNKDFVPALAQEQPIILDVEKKEEIQEPIALGPDNIPQEQNYTINLPEEKIDLVEDIKSVVKREVESVTEGIEESSKALEKEFAEIKEELIEEYEEIKEKVIDEFQEIKEDVVEIYEDFSQKISQEASEEISQEINNETIIEFPQNTFSTAGIIAFSQAENESKEEKPENAEEIEISEKFEDKVEKTDTKEKISEGEVPSPYLEHTSIPNVQVGEVKVQKEKIQPEIVNTLPSTSFFSKIRVLCGLILLVCFFTAPLLIENRELWYSDEVRHGAIYDQMVDSKEYFALSLNNKPYADKPPVYFWFLSALDKIPGVDNEAVFFAGTAISVLAFVLSIYFLGFCLGFNARILFGAGCMALTTGLSLALTQFSRMDMLFAALITFSFTCFFKAWIKKSAPVWLVFAFIFMGIACFVKGPFALGFPLVATLIFLIWRGNLRRLNDRDGLFGLLILIAMILTWFGILYYSGEIEYLSEIFSVQIVGRSINSWVHAESWSYYFIYLPLLLLPYTLILFFVNWKKAFVKAGTTIKQSRNKFIKEIYAEHAKSIEEGEKKPKLNKEKLHAAFHAAGIAWLYAICISGIILLTLVSSKLAIYTLPLFPAFILLFSKALMNLSGKASRNFFGLLGIVCIVLGVITTPLFLYDYLIPYVENAFPNTFALIPPYIHTILLNTSHIVYLGLAFLISGFVMVYGVNKVYPQKALFVFTLCIGFILWVCSFLVLPQVSPFISTKNVSYVLKEYIEKDYIPLSFHVYSGTFTYYAEHTIEEIHTFEELDTVLGKSSKAVLLFPKKMYDEWLLNNSAYSKEAKEVYQQYVASKLYVVATFEAKKIPESEVKSLEPMAVSQENVNAEEIKAEALPLEDSQIKPENSLMESMIIPLFPEQNNTMAVQQNTTIPTMN